MCNIIYHTHFSALQTPWMLECMLSPEWSDWKTCAAMRAFATAVIRMHSFLARTSDTLPTPALVRCFLFLGLAMHWDTPRATLIQALALGPRTTGGAFSYDMI